MNRGQILRTRSLGFFIGSIGLVFLLFACQQEVDSGRADESASATVEVEGGSVRLENGAQVVFERDFFAQAAEVTLASSTAPQASPESAGERYAESVDTCRAKCDAYAALRSP